MQILKFHTKGSEPWERAVCESYACLMYDSDTQECHRLHRHAQVRYYDSNRLYLYISATVGFIQPRDVVCVRLGTPGLEPYTGLKFRPWPETPGPCPTAYQNYRPESDPSPSFSPLLPKQLIAYYCFSYSNISVLYEMAKWLYFVKYKFCFFKVTTKQPAADSELIIACVW